MRKKITIFLAVLIVSFSVAGCFKTKNTIGPVTLNVYGLDDSDVLNPIIAKYKDKYSSVSVRYKKFANPDEFEDLIVNEIAEGEGPDIFYVKNTWLPRHIKKTVPLQTDVMTPQKFAETFVNVAREDFVQPDPADGVEKVYALPLYVDTLALYYNKKDFEQRFPERGKPAGDWNTFQAESAQLRSQDPNNLLEHGTIALGRADNIRLAIDVIYNLFLQGGIDFYDDKYKTVTLEGAQKYFDYFLSFADSKNKSYSWSTDLASSSSNASGEVEAFLSGKVSAIFAYSDLYPRLETELKNVKSRAGNVISLDDIAIMPVPQFAENEADYKVFSNYYGLAVSRNSKNQKVAWDFVQFASSQENARIYHKNTKRPTARRDLIEEQKKEPITDIFISQLGYAGSFRIFSDQKFAQFIKEAVSAANQGQTSSGALSNMTEKMDRLLKIESPEGLYPASKKKAK